MSDFHLVVLDDFDGHTRGTIVSDADGIKAALAEHPDKVVRILSHLSPEHRDDAVGDVITQTGT